MLVLSFACLIAAGSVALYLLEPGRSSEGNDLLAAVFTAVSAVCVTGLTVIDVSGDMNRAGQIVLLVLIQAGGVGILTLSNWILLSLRGRLRLYGTSLVHEAVGSTRRLGAAALVRSVMAYTAVCEIVGIGLLFWRFEADFSVGEALWLAVFHSVSAFCNAGFSLFTDGLVGYREDVAVNVVIMTLIFLGGIGFVVASDLASWAASLARGARRSIGGSGGRGWLNPVER